MVKCGDALLGEGNSVVSGEEFELGRGENHSINEIASYFGEGYPTEYIASRKGEYDRTLCEDKITQELLDWNPTINLDDYIEDFVENNNEKFLKERNLV